MEKTVVVSALMPFEVRAALVRASAIQNPLERTKAIQRIEEMAHHNHPELFKDPHDEYYDCSQ